MKVLSIQIPTIEERKAQFDLLYAFIKNTLDLYDLNDQVEILTYCDNKELTIGAKRQKLYEMSQGVYSWQIDDDDSIAADAIQKVLEATKIDADCITFQEKCIIDGVESNSNFSIYYPEWAEKYDGWDHVRTPFFKTPILTNIARLVTVPDIRFGEDHQWAKAIHPLLKSEVHIREYLYYYTHTSSPFNERYGIKPVHENENDETHQ